LARVDRRNTSCYWNDPQLAGLSCLAADFTDHDYAPHSHDALVVAVTEAGGSEFKSRGAVQEASPAELLVFNPAEPHSGRMGRSVRWRYRGFYLAQPALASLARTLGTEALPYFNANIIRDGKLISAFLDLHRSLQAGTDALLQDERLVASYGQLFRQYGSGRRRVPLAGRDRGAVAAVQRLLSERYGEPLTLAEMGRRVDLTPFQLIGLFKQSLGLTPHAYLTQVRLAAAMRALGHGASIAEAALGAGFYDQAALSNRFKRAYGITPLQWLRAAAADGVSNFDQ
jgi:AraC-like DNA-binding protein